MRPLLLAVCLVACRPPPHDRHPTIEPEEESEPDVVVALTGRDDASGTKRDPVRSIARALALVGPGDELRVSKGVYVLTEPVEVRVSGEPGKAVRITAEEGAVLDARMLEVGPPSGAPPYEQDQGAFVLRGVAFVSVSGLRIVHSHNAAITVRDSSHVELLQNRTSHTFSSGIAVWDSQHVQIEGNEVARASDRSLAPAWFDPKTMAAPHEGITLSGVEHFVVQGNVVRHGFKEGIDVKGDSKHGVVKRNVVHDNERQGIYVDAWEGSLVDIEVVENEVHHNRSSGVVISAEGEGARVEDIRVLRNRIEENYGPGVFISRFGKDGAKQRIAIQDNDVRSNGWGPPHGEISPLHWITGGLYLFSVNVDGLVVAHNRFVDNRAFQIGCSSDWTAHSMAERENEIAENEIWPQPAEGTVSTGWPVDDPDTIVACPGERARVVAPEAW